MAVNRYYSNTAADTTLASNASSGATTIVVSATTGFPLSYPYTLVLDPGLATQELVEVASASGTTLTVTRGVDGTSAQSHTAGAVVRHDVSARDYREPQEHIAASSAVHGVAGTLVGTSDTQTLTGKTIDLGSNTVSGTKAEFNTACTDADFATLTGLETLTGKTLSLPAINGGVLDSSTSLGGVSGTQLFADHSNLTSIQSSWTTWTPTITGSTTNPTHTSHSAYKSIGNRTLHVRFQETITALGSGTYTSQLPAGLVPLTTVYLIGNTSASQEFGGVLVVIDTSGHITFWSASAQIGSSTIGTNCIISFSGTIEVS